MACGVTTFTLRSDRTGRREDLPMRQTSERYSFVRYAVKRSEHYPKSHLRIRFQRLSLTDGASKCASRAR